MPGDIPVVGDMNKDGAEDVAIFRSSDYTWHIMTQGAVDGSWRANEIRAFGGMPGDLPVVGDINQDGKSDVAIYRVHDGGWWHVDTNGDWVADEYLRYGGGPGTIPFVADINGDGKDDLIVCWPAGRTWWVDTNRDLVPDRIYTFGQGAGDIPFVKDVTGDGYVDLIVFRNGVWQVDAGPNYDGQPDLQFVYGVSGDVPLVW
jgi:hypothetical protein